MYWRTGRTELDHISSQSSLLWLFQNISSSSDWWLHTGQSSYAGLGSFCQLMASVQWAKHEHDGLHHHYHHHYQVAFWPHPPSPYTSAMIIFLCLKRSQTKLIHVVPLCKICCLLYKGISKITFGVNMTSHLLCHISSSKQKEDSVRWGH